MVPISYHEEKPKSIDKIDLIGATCFSVPECLKGMGAKKSLER
jgi:hypothetical protein